MMTRPESEELEVARTYGRVQYDLRRKAEAARDRALADLQNCIGQRAELSEELDEALAALERLVEACETEPQLKKWDDALDEARSLLDSVKEKS